MAQAMKTLRNHSVGPMLGSGGASITLRCLDSGLSFIGFETSTVAE